MTYSIDSIQDFPFIFLNSTSARYILPDSVPMLFRWCEYESKSQAGIIAGIVEYNKIYIPARFCFYVTSWV
ncbi:hypothetical protein ES707_16902 [subsurface metagenome]